MRPSTRVDVHPNDHLASALPQTVFDVIFIGSGWACRVAGARLVKAGLSVLIIEDELIGGDCPFWACVPSKVLLHPEQAVRPSSATSETPTSRDGVDASAVFARRDMFTGGHSDKPLLIPMMEEAHVTLARGKGSLTWRRIVRIKSSAGGSDQTLHVEARLAVVIGTGSEPVIPNIPGLKEANIWDPRDATSSNYVPKHLVVVGAGAVGTEMATAYSSFGSKVTLISSSKEILPLIDDEAGRIVREAFESRGVAVKTRTRAVRINRTGEDGDVVVELSNGEQVVGTELLFAAGRKPKIEALTLENIGLKAEKRGLPVDDTLNVSLPHQGQDEKWLYAVGDVNGRALLTHTSKYHGRIVSNAILARSQGKKLSGRNEGWASTSATADIAAVPQVVFTDPPVASVGLTMKAAKAQGKVVREVTAPFVTLGGKIASNKAIEGWAQWLLDSEDTLVGATFVGIGAEDQLHASTVAVVGGLKLDRLFHAIPSFPTQSEVYLNLIEAAGL